MPVSETESKSLATCMTSRANPPLEEWNGRTATLDTALSDLPRRLASCSRHPPLADRDDTPAWLLTCALAGRGTWRWRASRPLPLGVDVGRHLLIQLSPTPQAHASEFTNSSTPRRDRSRLRSQRLHHSAHPPEQWGARGASRR